MDKYKQVKYICTECGKTWFVKCVLNEDFDDYEVLHEKDTTCHRCGELGVEWEVARG